MFDVLARLLAWYYAAWPSFAVAIVLLTLTVRLALLPLTAKQVRSMRAMQHLQPEIKRLQQQYKDDRRRLNDEMTRLYREKKVNPLAGCLPLALQMPIFIALSRVVRGLTATPPRYLDEGSALYKALAAGGGRMQSLGMDLARSAASRHASVGAALPYYALVAAVIVTGMYQQRQLAARRAPADAVSSSSPGAVAAMMPALFGFISLSIPAGVVLYFLVSNVWQIAQQAFVLQTQPADADGTSPRFAA